MDGVAWRSWPTRALAAALAVAAALVLAWAIPARAGVERVKGGVDGVHDARYCEVLVLRGLPPTAEVRVWNTLSLNRCPAAKWNRLDAGALARELGATAVVLNGPRHFLMDSVRGAADARRTFGGLRMGSVARIKIRTAADLAQRTYAER